MRAKIYFISIVVCIFIIAVSAFPANATIRIMPLGDSITQGIGSGADPDDNDHQVSYRKTLWDLLVNAGYDVDFVGSQDSGSMEFADPDHEAYPGGRADEIRDGIYNWLVAHPADIILLHIGTNDINEPQCINYNNI